MKKKLLILLSTMTMLFSIIVPSALAQGETCSTNYSDLLNSVQDCQLPSNLLNCDEDVQKVLGDYVTNTGCTSDELSAILDKVDCSDIEEVSADQLQDLLNEACAQDKVAGAAVNGDSVNNSNCPQPVATEAKKTVTATEKSTETSTPAATTKTTATEEPVATTTPTATEEPVSTATPAATVAPTATTTTSTNASSLEQQMVDLVNADRAEAGLAPLTIDSGLTSAARAHSNDMSANNYFSHTSPTNGTFSERLKASGISYKGAGENIALYNSITKAEAGLMASEGHRANILNTSFTHIGIGIVWNESKGAYYITQWFASK